MISFSLADVIEETESINLERNKRKIEKGNYAIQVISQD